ncbi:MgtC/SapB family protein [Qipengyuania sp. XHP0211]|uniref:MgtC/SapB family protein n=1 Tax=Qipengyuania sp. XHP0211 TaxID=3038079 RepID=UPI00241EE22E|nr:MgtC/SapB family protein [Qipengyuania sp. XHP0211]MDG5750845.1 MgtC/SapB family protein [Qipengyuania sp. XHP0211]
MTDMLHPSSLSWFDVAWRLGAATLFPLIVGLERFFHKKPIDFRPFVIISVAACGLLIGSIELLQSSNDSQAQIDPTRVIEGVITGIGFIGAGAMFREGNYVQGAGSAASIWCAGAIGLVCGMGELWLGAIVSIIVFLLLVVSSPFTERWDPGSTKGADEE